MPDISGFVLGSRTVVLTAPFATEVGVLWGDGSASERALPAAPGAPVTLSHEFVADGSYAIRTRSTGIDGGVATERLDVLIALGDMAGIAVAGGGGDDLMVGGLGNDSLAGGRDDDMLLGGTGHDALHGGDGADTLAGGIGSDTLIGGADTWGDLFVLDALGEGVDRPRGFDPALDTLRLVFVAPGTPFLADATPVAQGGGQWLLYDTDSGLLSFDIDGDGPSAPIALAVLIGAPALTAAQLSFGPIG